MLIFLQMLSSPLFLLLADSYALDWLPEKKIDHSVDKKSLYFVNRDQALTQLQLVHKKNFNFTKCANSGLPWSIPLCQAINGLGKTTFAAQYIQQCRNHWYDVEKRDDFETTLCRCHTVLIHFEQDSFSDTLSTSENMIVLLKNAIAKQFRKPPACLKRSYSLFKDFLADLTAEAGPLFIALDDVGVPFEGSANKQIMQSLEEFLDFCKEISTLFDLKNVFFLFLGDSAFLSLIGGYSDWTTDRIRVKADVFSNQFDFQLLEFHLLGPEFISKILLQTCSDSEGGPSISKYFGLNNTEVEILAQDIFKETCGHPSTIANALKIWYKTGEVSLPGIPLNIKNWETFYGEIIRHPTALFRLLTAVKTKQTVNMGKLCTESGACLEDMVPLVHVASNVGMMWDGRLDKATLHFHPFLRINMEQALDLIRLIKTSKKIK